MLDVAHLRHDAFLRTEFVFNTYVIVRVVHEVYKYVRDYYYYTLITKVFNYDLLYIQTIEYITYGDLFVEMVLSKYILKYEYIRNRVFAFTCCIEYIIQEVKKGRRTQHKSEDNISYEGNKIS